MKNNSQQSDEEVYGPDPMLPDDFKVPPRKDDPGLKNYESSIQEKEANATIQSNKKLNVEPETHSQHDKSLESAPMLASNQIWPTPIQEPGLMPSPESRKPQNKGMTSQNGDLREFQKHIQAKLVEGLEKSFKKNKTFLDKSLKKGKEAIKQQLMEFNYFQGQAQKIMKYDDKALEAQEPEKEFSPVFGYVKLAIMGIIGILAAIYIIVANFSKIGSEKSQQVSILKYNDLSYYVGDDVGGIQSLFPLHHFTTFNKQEVLDRMGCLVLQDVNLCNKYEERKCEVYGMKNQEYDNCMLVQYEKAGMDLKSFCNNHYKTSNPLWTKQESTSSGFYLAKYECLLNAGVKRGQEYCDDQNVINPTNTLTDLYACYDLYNVLNSTYADDKCSFMHKKMSENASDRQGYIDCMGVMKVDVEPSYTCLNKNFWIYDFKKVSKCEAIGNVYLDYVKNGTDPTTAGTQFIQEFDDCGEYFDIPYNLDQCYKELGSSMRYNIDTCNTVVWLEFSMASVEQQIFDFDPPVKNYFECYFTKTQMKNETAYKQEHKQACENLFKTDQRKLLKCYDEIGVEYGLKDQIKICTNEYKLQSQIDTLYDCMAEFNVNKNEEYCNLNLDYNSFIYEIDWYVHVEAQNANKEPYFNCQKENSKTKTLDVRYCTEEIEIFKMLKSMGAELPLDKAEMVNCLAQYDMPEKGVYQTLCSLNYIYNQPQGYVSTGEYCNDRFDAICYNYYYEVLTDQECNQIYLDSYKFAFKGDAKFDEDFKVQCRKAIIDMTEYNACMDQITDEMTLQQMNDDYKKYLTSIDAADQFLPFSDVQNQTLIEYCNLRFSDDFYNRLGCLELIGFPLGPQECLEIPEYNDNEIYHFSYFGKYLCLKFKKVELDEEAYKCLFDSSVQYYSNYDMPFVTSNECLQKYENKHDTAMRLKKINGLDIYTQIKIPHVDEVPDTLGDEPIIIQDRPSKLTDEEIQDFLCDALDSQFITSPYSQKVDKKLTKHNQMSFKMSCESLNYFNGTNNNTIVHLFFPQTNKHGLIGEFQDSKFSKDQIAVNRTDTNFQMFNLTMGEDVNFLQVQSHMLYKFEEVDEPTQHSIKNAQDFDEFIGNAQTSNIFKTGQMVVADQRIQEAELIANPTKIIENGKKVTRKILGVGVEFIDVEKKKVEITKVNTLLSTVDKSALSREDRAQINSFVMNLRINFSEQTVIYQYFSFLDIVGLLGGLWATFKSISAQLGVVSIIMYVYKLAQMIRRKDAQRYRILEIKQYVKHLPMIKEQILKEMTSGNEKQLNEDLKKIELAENLPMEKYDDTIEKHELLKELMTKYHPDGLEDIFGHQTCTTEWEMLENFENDTKHKYFEKKMGFSLADISDEIKERMSFYGIYMIKDRAEMEHIKIKKIKYQLRNANERVIMLESRLNDLENKMK